MAKINTVFKEATVVKTDNPNVKIRNIHIDSLVESKYQYRDLSETDVRKLAEIISADGKVLQPLLVRKAGADTYEILAGHKRYRACKLLVEEEGRTEFAMLPCCVEAMDDVQAEFAAYSTNNAYGEKSPYDLMCEIDGMRRLIKENPDAFGETSGRLVDRLGKQLGLATSTVKEFEAIRKNLGKRAMAAFKNGEIGKSAALALSQHTEIEQNAAIRAGKLTYTEIKAFFAPKYVPDSGTSNAAENEIPGQRHVTDIKAVLPEIGIHPATPEEKTKYLVPLARCIYDQLQNESLEYLQKTEDFYLGLLRRIMSDGRASLEVICAGYPYTAQLLPTHICLEGPSWMKEGAHLNIIPEGFADLCREIWPVCKQEAEEEEARKQKAALEEAAKPEPTAEEINKLFERKNIRGFWGRDKAENAKNLKNLLRYEFSSDCGKGSEKGYQFHGRREVSWTRFASLIMEHVSPATIERVVKKNENRQAEAQKNADRAKRIRDLEEMCYAQRRAFCLEMLNREIVLPNLGREKEILDVIICINQTFNLLSFALDSWSATNKEIQAAQEKLLRLSVEERLLYILLVAAKHLSLVTYVQKINTEDVEQFADMYKILEAYGYQKSQEEVELLTIIKGGKES